MANHTQIGSAVVNAFQWNGGTLNQATTVLPVWAKQIALHSPGDGSLNVPTPNHGTVYVAPGSWVIQYPTTGHIDVMSAATFALMFS